MPKRPIKIIILLSNIFCVTGQSSPINFPKRRDIAEIMMSIIPTILYPFVSIFYSPSKINKLSIVVCRVFAMSCANLRDGL